jgi:hypothetical protein
MSTTNYIGWKSLSEGEVENLRTKLLSCLLSYLKVTGVEGFEVTRKKRKDYRDKMHIDIEMKSLSEDSSATVVVEGDESFPAKTCLYVKRDDGYNHKNTVRYIVRQDETFNVEKAAKKLLELNEWSIERSVSQRHEKASETHQRRLKKMVVAELTSRLGDTWEVHDNWNAIRTNPTDGTYSPIMDINVRSLYAPQIKVEFGDVISDEPTNSKKLGLVTNLFSTVLNVLESDVFRASLEESPVLA